MAIIREQTLGILSTPPKFGFSLSAEGNVSNNQTFDASSGSYAPDYSITPLNIQVDVAAIDSELPLSSINARTLLANIHWYEIAADGSRTEIVVSGGSSTPPGYTRLVNTEGDPDAGLLQVARNAAPASPILLMFEADLIYGSDSFHAVSNFSIQCRDTTPSVRCKFDTPDIVPYNPIHDADTLPVTLSVWENGRPCDPSHYIPVWEVRREDGSWSVYGDEPTDYWLTVAADGRSASLNLDLMGDGIDLRVRLRYDRYGDPSSVTLAAGDISVPMCRLECSRNLGRYDHQLLNVTSQLAEWTTVIRPTVVFKDNKGEIPDPDRFFLVTFYAGPGGSALTAANAVGTGRTVDIRCDRASAAGLKIGYSVEEIGPWKAWADSDGKVLTDADGSVLLIR